MGIRKVCIENDRDYEMQIEYYWRDCFLFNYTINQAEKEEEKIWIEMKSIPNTTQKNSNFPHLIEIKIMSNLKLQQLHFHLGELLKQIAKQFALQW